VPVIFVHGVNNRADDPLYQARSLVIGDLLRRNLKDASIDERTIGQFEPAFPYWGDLGAKFSWNMQSLPSGGEALGAGVDLDLRAAVATLKDALDKPDEAKDIPLLALARYSFARAVDLLTDLVLQNTKPGQVDDAARFAIEAQLYAAGFETPGTVPPWLASVTTDAQFCDKLVQALRERAAAAPAQQALGGIAASIGNLLASAASKLRQATQAVASKVLDSTGDFASTKVLAWTRAPLNATLGRFFGDAFLYLDARGDKDHPGAIPKTVLSAWDSAIAAAPGEPLVIVGHSLGGVISYDLLTHFRPDIEVDLFVSVGSQVSHFEELKLFKASDPKYSVESGIKVPKPDNIRHWINVYDEVDIFSYSCKKIFEPVDDYAYDTRTYVIKAHGAYLVQARFYERLRARIDALTKP
jgi:hypothetical protein